MSGAGNGRPQRRVRVHRECREAFRSLPQSYRSHLSGGLSIRPDDNTDQVYAAFVDNYRAVLQTVRTPETVGEWSHDGLHIGPLWKYVLLGMEEENYRAMVAHGRDHESAVRVIAVSDAGIGPHSRNASIPKRELVGLVRWRKYVMPELARYRLGP